jgi:lipopolysaccharide transport system permease protein
MKLPASTYPYVRVQKSPQWVPLNLSDVWEHRELLYFLVWGDLKLRYKQTLLGVFWAILQPALAMIVFTVFFGAFAGLSSEGIPYPVFAYTALVPWTFFANSLSLASQSLLRYEKVITKVWFPRVIVPLSAILSGIVDLGVAALLGLFGLRVAFHRGFEAAQRVVLRPDPLALRFVEAEEFRGGTFMRGLSPTEDAS